MLNNIECNIIFFSRRLFRNVLKIYLDNMLCYKSKLQIRSQFRCLLWSPQLYVYVRIVHRHSVHLYLYIMLYNHFIQVIIQSIITYMTQQVMQHFLVIQQNILYRKQNSTLQHIPQNGLLNKFWCYDRLYNIKKSEIAGYICPSGTQTPCWDVIYISVL